MFARRIRNFFIQQVSELVKSIEWPESEDDGDFSADYSGYDPYFNYDAALRNIKLENDEQIYGANEAIEVADVQNIVSSRTKD